MKLSDNALNLLTAKTYKGIGNAWIYSNIYDDDCLEVIVEKIYIKDPTVSEGDFKQRKKIIENQILSLNENCDGVTCLLDSDFPYIRGNVKNSEKPIVLFYKGDITLLAKDNNNIAVIGLLDPDNQTEIDERHVVNTLVQHNVVIVSGLANGCDAIAHHQALLSGGLTVAILPSPLNNIQPSNNVGLAVDIVNNGGLVITEYFMPPQSKNELISRYIERDRLQALFSDCVLLSASYAQNNQGNDSGSRHALAKAKDYGLGRAVIYNHHHHSKNPKYDLNRQIIQETPQAIIIDPQSIHDGIAMILQPKYNTPYTDNKDTMPTQGDLF